MSSDYLLAIKADHNTCRPFTGLGCVPHVVRVSQEASMTIVNEFTDGGVFEHADCAPAAFQSWLLDRTTVRTSIRAIENLAGTGPSGTGFNGLIAAGRHLGFEIRFSHQNPPPGHIMNPGGFSRIVDIAEFPSYLAATQGGCLVLPDLGPDQLEDEEMRPMLVTTNRLPTDGPDPHGPGAVYLVANWPYGPKRWISSPTFLPPYKALLGEIQPVNAFVLDRCEEQPPITAGFTLKP